MSPVLVLALVLVVVGSVAQIAGLLIAGAGVLRTRREYDPSYRGLWAWLPWRRRSAQVHAIAGTARSISNAEGSIEITLKHEADSIARDLRILDDRTQELGTAIRNLRRNVTAEVRELREGLDQSRADATKATIEAVRRLAIGGLSQQALGLWITGGGVIVALVGSVVQALA